MMDLIYAYRDDGDGWNLRYSLRSHDVNMSNIGRVIVTGDPPDWLADSVIKVRCLHLYPRKQQNILAEVVEAMETARVDGPALYSSDDHFIVGRFDADSFPWFSRQGFWSRFPTAEELLKSGRQMNNWRGSMVRTGDLFRSVGWPDDNWSGHYDTHIDGRDLPTVRKIMQSPWWHPFGLEPSSLFIAAARARDRSITGAPVKDRKIAADMPESDCDRLAAESSGIISVAESAACPMFRKWMEARFPEPCRWEAS